MHCTMASRSVVVFSHACFGQSFLVAAVRSLSQAAQSVGLYESLPLFEMSARPPGSLQVKLFLRGSCVWGRMLGSVPPGAAHRLLLSAPSAAIA